LNIIDFGVAAEKKTDKALIISMAGRWEYASPEMLLI